MWVVCVFGCWIVLGVLFDCDLWVCEFASGLRVVICVCAYLMLFVAIAG